MAADKLRLTLSLGFDELSNVLVDRHRLLMNKPERAIGNPLNRQSRHVLFQTMVSAYHHRCVLLIPDHQPWQVDY